MNASPFHTPGEMYTPCAKDAIESQKSNRKEKQKGHLISSTAAIVKKLWFTMSKK